MTVQVFY